jgi:hypothetical protein
MGQSSRESTASEHRAFHARIGLNQHLTWRRTLVLAGRGDPGPGPLPAHPPCPLCGGRASVLEDFPNRGCWWYCVDCRFGGDSIELLAAVRDTPVAETIRHHRKEFDVPDSDFEPGIANYLTYYVGARAAMAGYVRQCSAQVFVAVIAVNHFRLVNARIEAARPCADQRR